MSTKNKKKFLNDINDYVIGVDEVGRGALCGPVVSCSVLLKKEILLDELVNQIDDSKKLSEKKRVNLSIFIKKNSFYSFGLANNKEIDEVNILNATILSMKRALEKFNGYTNTVKIDGQKIFNYNEKTFFIKKGDSKSISIASASILAKTFRDKLMCDYAKQFPAYNWNRNKGYGTRQHIAAIKKLGYQTYTEKVFYRI